MRAAGRALLTQPGDEDEAPPPFRLVASHTPGGQRVSETEAQEQERLSRWVAGRILASGAEAYDQMGGRGDCGRRVEGTGCSSGMAVMVEMVVAALVECP